MAIQRADSKTSSYNYEAYGKKYWFAENSLFVFTLHNPLRRLALRLMLSPWFERLILALIVVNTVFLGLQDFSHIETDPMSPSVGLPVREGSWRNQLVLGSDVVFTAFFALEALIKIVAMGFYWGDGAYLRDDWNKLDFVVTAVTLLVQIPQMPSYTFVRSFRVLRPLRSLSIMPGLQRLVQSMVRAFPQLVSVIVLLFFIFLVFGIFGVSFFSGILHTRCRLTPFPVLRTWDGSLDNVTQYSCFNLPNADTSSVDMPLRSASPWSTPRDCYWPVDPLDSTVCTLGQGGGGIYQCLHDLPNQQVEDYRYCGSNFDYAGNMRFTAGELDGRMLSQKEIALSAEWTVDRDFGLAQFDNIGGAFLTIFQTMTGNGWSDVMYGLQNAAHPVVGALFFVILVIFGSFFALNLLLAVLANSFEETKGQELKDIEEEDLQTVYEMEVIKHAVSYRGVLYDQLQAVLRHPRCNAVVMTCILVNTVVLSLDHYPLEPGFGLALESINFVLSLIFMLEMGAKLLCFGVNGYCADMLNVFDAIIVMLSIVELLVAPPSILAARSTTKSGVLSVLRSFRLFRVFKLARGWQSMRILLSTIIRTARDMRHFVLLLVLFIYVYALVGMQLFARRFVFDRTGHAVQIGTPEWSNPFQVTIASSNFDDIVAAFTTVFQILSGDDWEEVMYDGYRATGVSSFFYFISLIVCGQFIIMNIFLAILLSNFLNAPMEEDEEDAHNKRTSGSFRVSRTAKSVCSCLAGLFRRKKRVLSLPAKRQTSSSSSSSTASRPSRLISGQDRMAEDNLDGLYPGKVTQPQSHRMTGGTDRDSFDRRLSSRLNAAQPPNPLRHSTRGWLSTLLAPFSSPPPRKLKVIPLAPQSPVASVTHSTHNPACSNFSHPSTREGLTDGAIGNEAEAYAQAKFAGERQPSAVSSGDDSELNHSQGTTATGQDSMGRTTQLDYTPVGPYKLHPGSTLFLFSPAHPLRALCAHVATHPHFVNAVLFLIALSSVLLALDNPLLDPSSTLFRFLDRIDYALNLLFTLEMGIKIIAYGLVLQPSAYLRDPWNVLDGCILLVSAVGYLTPSTHGRSINALRALRSLRALRPLRVIQRAPGLKLVVESLLRSVPDVLNVFAVCCIFFLIFSILMVNFFKGQLRACSGPAFDEMVSTNRDYVTFLAAPRPWSELSAREKSWFGPQSNVTSFSSSGCPSFPSTPCCPSHWRGDEAIVTSKMVCGCWGLDWGLVTPQSFDDVGTGLISLFEMSSRDGWTAVMAAAVDSAGIDMQPQRYRNRELVILFIAFMVVGSYLMMNLFVGVILNNFNSVKDMNEGGISVLTDHQKAWIKTQQTALRLRPKKRVPAPRHPLRAAAFRLCESRAFDSLCSVCIVLNTVSMAMQYFGQDDQYTYWLTDINYAFALFFTIEALIKIVAYGRHYFLSSWDLFDFVIMTITNLGLVLMWTTHIDFGSIAMAIRTVRIGRLLRLSRKTKTLNKLFQTLLITLPGLGNTGVLLFLFFFIYSLMGMQLFGKVAHHGSVNHNANFEGFWVAMLTLLRFSTGEGFADFTRDMSRAPPGCDPDPSYDPTTCGFKNFPGCRPINGCGTVAIYPYIISFQLLISFVFINLFIGVILDGFDTADEERRLIKVDDFAVFERAWTDFDPNATMLIELHRLNEFLLCLPPPLGFKGKDVPEKEIIGTIKRLDLYVFEGHSVHFQDVIMGLSKEAMLRETLGEDFLNVPAAITDRLINTRKLRVRRTRAQQKLQLEALQEFELTTAHHAAAVVLKNSMRRFIKQRKSRAERRRIQAMLLESLTYSSSINGTAYPAMEHTRMLDDQSIAALTHLTPQERVEAFGDIEPPDIESLLAQAAPLVTRENDTSTSSAPPDRVRSEADGQTLPEGDQISHSRRVRQNPTPTNPSRAAVRLDPLGVDVRNPMLKGSRAKSPSTK